MNARAWLAVLVLFVGGAGEAFAQANANACNLTQRPPMETGSGQTYPTKTAAMARCRADHYGGNLYQESVYAYTGGKRFEGTCKERPSQGKRIQFNETRTEEWSTILKDGQYTCNPNTIVVTHAADTSWRGYYIYTTDDCPAPKVIDEAGQCVDAKARCMKKADAKASSSELFTGTKCIDGCQYGKKNGGLSSAGGQSIIWGDIGFTGDTCSSVPADPLQPRRRRKKSA